MKVILDLDTGIDDGMALAYTVGNKDMELLGVTGTFGNVYTEVGARNALNLLNILGEPKIPVFMGATHGIYRILAALLQKKAGLNERIHIAYRKDDRRTLLEISQKELKEMENLSEELRLLRQEIWMKEYKPFGYEILDIRLGGVGIRARSEAARLQAYAEGKLEHIEELEETLLPYLSQEPLEKEELRRCSLWEEIVSAGNMEGV